MKEYKVVIEETVSETVPITADSEKEALRIAEQLYKKSEIVLEPGSLIDVRFSIADN